MDLGYQLTINVKMWCMVYDVMTCYDDQLSCFTCDQIHFQEMSTSVLYFVLMHIVILFASMVHWLAPSCTIVHEMLGVDTILAHSCYFGRVKLMKTPTCNCYSCMHHGRQLQRRQLATHPWAFSPPQFFTHHCDSALGHVQLDQWQCVCISVWLSKCGLHRCRKFSCAWLRSIKQSRLGGGAWWTITDGEIITANIT